MTEEEQKKIFSQNLKKYLNENRLNQNEVAKDIGVSPQTFNTWCKAKAIPRMGKIEKLANYFKIQKSDLIDSQTPPAPKTINDIDFTGIERIAAEHKGENFTQDELKFIQDTIDFVVAKKRKSNKKDGQPND